MRIYHAADTKTLVDGKVLVAGSRDPWIQALAPPPCGEQKLHSYRRCRALDASPTVRSIGAISAALLKAMQIL